MNLTHDGGSRPPNLDETFFFPPRFGGWFTTMAAALDDEIDNLVRATDKSISVMEEYVLCSQDPLLPTELEKLGRELLEKKKKQKKKKEVSSRSLPDDDWHELLARAAFHRGEVIKEQLTALDQMFSNNPETQKFITFQCLLRRFTLAKEHFVDSLNLRAFCHFFS